MKILQLSFDFTLSVRNSRRERTPSWRIALLSKRHRISLSQAKLYAAEMGLLDTEVQDG